MKALILSVGDRDHFVAEWLLLKCPSPAIVGSFGIWRILRPGVAAVHAACVSVSPEETSEAASRQLISEMSPDTQFLGLQLSCVEGPRRRQGGSWVHVEAWDTGKEWKQNSKGELWLLWHLELLAGPDVVGVALQGLRLGRSWRRLGVWGSQHQRRSMVLSSSVADLQMWDTGCLKYRNSIARRCWRLRFEQPYLGSLPAFCEQKRCLHVSRR